VLLRTEYGGGPPPTATTEHLVYSTPVPTATPYIRTGSDYFAGQRVQVGPLVLAARAGDERAWNELVDEFGNLVWSITRAHGLYAADAADSVLERPGTDALRTVLHSGPETGVHTIGWWRSPQRLKTLLTLGAAPDDLGCVVGLDVQGAELGTLIPGLPPAWAPRPARALVFDSLYDSYRGVIAYVRMVDGRLAKGDRLRMMAAGHVTEAEEAGVFAPEAVPTPELAAGEVGYLIPGVKDVRQVRVGDTVTTAARPAAARSGWRP